ncbi:AP2/ERF and B3 domain-containing transcription factor [Nymphaea thermarum]|nr:AP2/ERF and B3 domain-containing transcription factor [Nymphaea thermarum]
MRERKTKTERAIPRLSPHVVDIHTAAPSSMERISEYWSIEGLEDQMPFLLHGSNSEPRTTTTADSRLGLVTPTRRLPCSRYKGVVPQPNGKWGAQIYERNHRLWLGTFRTEVEAAVAYDVAVLKFRGGEAVTNFRIVWEDQHQTCFLEAHSKEEIIDMLRRNTYHDELAAAEERGAAAADSFPSSSWAGRESRPRFLEKEELFDKVLTPSDVGKLNRLVIPKHQAEACFPQLLEGESDGLLLSFEDECGRVWRIKYCYWSSSQSFVLTRGFVREKGLKAGDVITFFRSKGLENMYYINWKSSEAGELHQTTEEWPQCRSVLKHGLLHQQGQSIRLFGTDLTAQHIEALSVTSNSSSSE